MFISQEDLRKRLSSKDNLLNIIRPKHVPITPANLNTPDHNPPPAENLPDETAKQKAARIARTHINQSTIHGEYTINPNIDNDILRATIGVLTTQTSSKEIQKEFGLTKNQVTGIKNTTRKDLRQRISEGKDRISELAIDRLMETLGLLTPDKIMGEKPKDMSTISANLAKIISSLKPDAVSVKEQSNVTLTIYAPEVKESKYKVIDV